MKSWTWLVAHCGMRNYLIAVELKLSAGYLLPTFDSEQNLTELTHKLCTPVPHSLKVVNPTRHPFYSRFRKSKLIQSGYDFILIRVVGCSDFTHDIRECVYVAKIDESSATAGKPPIYQMVGVVIISIARFVWMTA